MLRHIEDVAEQMLGARRRTARLGHLHRNAAERQTGEERGDRIGLAGRHPLGIGDHRTQIVHEDVPRRGNDRLRTEQVGDHPLGTGRNLGRQIGVARRRHLLRCGGQHPHVGQNHPRGAGLDVKLGPVARDDRTRRRIAVDRRCRGHAEVRLVVMERGEFAEVVDDARAHGDNDGARAVERFVDPLDIGIVGVELLLFEEKPGSQGTPASRMWASTASPAAFHVLLSATIRAFRSGKCSRKSAGARCRTPSPSSNAFVSVAILKASRIHCVLFIRFKS